MAGFGQQQVSEFVRNDAAEQDAELALAARGERGDPVRKDVSPPAALRRPPEHLGRHRIGRDLPLGHLPR